MDHNAQNLPDAAELWVRASGALERCGLAPERISGTGWSTSPVNGLGLAKGGVPQSTHAEIEDAVERSADASRRWRTVPAPKRGALIGKFRELVSERKSDLSTLITLEVGKIASEAQGEIQEVIDICEFAIGQSRQLYGRTMPSERPGHRLMETWHPLGPIAIISAFNFPAAVWSWNASLALVCGDSVLWKPSEVTPLTSMAISALLQQAIAEQGAPDGLHQLLLGNAAVGQTLAEHEGVRLVSATGSTSMGHELAPVVAGRLGRSLLELGGNNAAVVSGTADIELAVRAIVFAAAGTAGQRCTTLRRVIVHESVAEELTSKIAAAYRGLPVGNPLVKDTLVGPLINQNAFESMAITLEALREEGGSAIVGGGRELEEWAPGAYYVRPALIRMPRQSATVRRETFAPILTILTYSDFDEAIAINNDVPQGLSSSVFTTDFREAEKFISAEGSDCGIINVNIGTSGAEVGGAFGGEKETGGGRESGSDAWKVYMRRATNTINYSEDAPLAQGVEFG